MAKINLTKFFSAAIIALIVIACGLLFMSANTYAATDEQDSNDVTAIDEQEPNDTLSTAQTISIGDLVYGQTDMKKGYDYYRFTPIVSGTLNLTAWDDDIKSRMDVVVLNENNEELASFRSNYDSLAGIGVQIGVVYGKTYYVEIRDRFGVGSSLMDYRFKLSYAVGKTDITKVTSKKAAFYLKWNKKSNASYYQIKYTKKSTYNDYGWSKATIYNTSSNSGSATIKGLSKKTAYYTAVRVVRVIDEKTYYSNWSKAKTVKTK